VLKNKVSGSFEKTRNQHGLKPVPSLFSWWHRLHSFQEPVSQAAGNFRCNSRRYFAFAAGGRPNLAASIGTFVCTWLS
jgi:hypothetical protein